MKPPFSMGFTHNIGYDTMFEKHTLNQTLRRKILTLQKLWNNAQAVLFDFDGVLADSEPFYRKSWNTVLAEYNHSVPEQIYWKHWAFLGEGLPGEMKRTGLLVKDPDRLKSQQKLLYTSYCKNGEVPLFPLAAEVVEIASTKKECIIASNTESKLVKSVISTKIKNPPPIIGGEGLRSKPFPDIFLRAAASLSVDPSRCLVFEDAWKGVRAAGEAGMPAVLIRNKYNEGLPAPEASCELRNLRELYLFLKDLG